LNYFSNVLKNNFALLKTLLFAFLLLFYTNFVNAQAPIISDFTPNAAQNGSTIIINGSNFNGNLPDNLVFFGQIRANVISANSNSLTVTVPNGASYGPITVLNLSNGLYGNSALSFNPNFVSKRDIKVNDFDPRLDINLTKEPFHISIEDLDDDGKPDLILSNPKNNSISIFKNNFSNGVLTTLGFSTEVEIPLNGDVFFTKIIDIDGDGKKDIIALSRIGNKIIILKNNCAKGVINSSSIINSLEITSSGSPSRLNISDLDLDGKPDLIVTNNLENTVSIYKNISSKNIINNSSFATPIKLSSSVKPDNIEVRDLNKDGKPELLILNKSPSRSVSIYQNKSSIGNIIFDNKFDLDINSSSTDIKVEDLDGDSNLEICVLKLDEISVYRNKGLTNLSIDNFEYVQSVKLDFNYTNLSIADFDGDGKPDFASYCNNTSTLALARNKVYLDTRTFFEFTPKVNLSSKNANAFGDVSDLNGDGLVDIITVSSISKVLSIYQNNPKSSPIITSFSPQRGNIGSTIVLDGYHFNKDLTKNIVKFGEVNASIINGTDERLEVSVPSGFANEPISITNTDLKLSNKTSNRFSVTFASNQKIEVANFDRINLEDIKSISGLSSEFADFDNDGKPDLIFAFNGKLIIQKNVTQNGSHNLQFGPKIEIALQIQNLDGKITLTDINSDGKTDIIIDDKYIFINKFNGILTKDSFSSQINLADFENLILADLDMDGKPDFAWTRPNLYFTKNIFDETVSSNTFFNKYYDSQNRPVNFKIIDINQDQKPDVLAYDIDKRVILIYKNISDNSNEIDRLTFDKPIEITNSFLFVNFIISDIDGDGKLDIIGYNENDKSIAVFQNKILNGTVNTNSFKKILLDIKGNFRTLHTVDLDGDGKLDLVFSNNEKNRIEIYKNNYNGFDISTDNFSKATFLTVFNSQNVGFCDINNDGLPDILVKSFYSNVTDIFLNTIEKPNPPHVESFVPLKAKTGDEIIISGRNFNSTIDSNIVYFGSVKAQVISASPNQLKVVVPSGKTLSKISVFNAGTKLTGFSKTSFIGVFESKNAITKADIEPSKGFDFNKFVLFDINNDGKSDLFGITPDDNSHSFKELRNSSSTDDLQFNSVPSYILRRLGIINANDITIADIDLDGKPDFILADSITNQIHIGLNTSKTIFFQFSPSYAINEAFTTGNKPVKIIVGDLDLDGKVDVITLNAKSNTISIFKNLSSKGTAFFGEKIEIETGKNPSGIYLADLNNDGLLDIVITNKDDNTISIFQNSSTINKILFSNKINLSVQNKPNSVTCIDINNDNFLDIIVTNNGSNTITILDNNSNGNLNSASFTNKVNFEAEKQPFDIAGDDIDGDGYVDLVVSNFESNSISVFRNANQTGPISTSSLNNKVNFLTEDGPTALTIGDYDNDGKPDIGVYNSLNGRISIFKNNPVIPLKINDAPFITFFSPLKASIDQTVTIVGGKFGDNPANIVVLFGTIRAELTSISDNLLTVKVPAGTGLTKISVINTNLKLSCLSNYKFSIISTSKKSIQPNDYEELNLASNLNIIDALKTGDLNNDGLQEIVYSDRFNKAYVLLNDNKNKTFNVNNFKQVLVLNSPGIIRKILIEDINADGKPDLFFKSDHRTTIYINTTTGNNLTFQNAFQVDIETSEIVDVDGDGLLDLVQEGFSVSQNKSVDGNVSRNSFQKQIIFNTSLYNNTSPFGDFNNDGKQDVYLSGRFNELSSIFMNISVAGRITTASFDDRVKLKNISNINDIIINPIVVDVDNDGKNDLFDGRKIYKNNIIQGKLSDDSFSTIQLKNITNDYINFKTEDLDGDGKLDFIYSNKNDYNIGLSRNNGITGIITSNDFEKPIYIGEKVEFGFVFDVADLDADGKPDILLNNYNPSSSLKLFRYKNKIEPIINFSNTETQFTTGTKIAPTPVNIDTELEVIYLGKQYLSSSTIKIKDYKNSEDKLNITLSTNLTGDIESDFNSTSGILTLVSKNNLATLSQWQNALRTLTYFNSNTSTLSVLKTLEITITDNVNTSPIYLRNIAIISNPTITDFFPKVAFENEEITINGENFSNITSITLGGVNVKSFTVRSRNQMVAIINYGASGELKVITTNGEASKSGFRMASKPEITANGPTTFLEGGSVILNLNEDLGIAYQWYLNGGAILGANKASFTATKSGDYTIGTFLNNNTYRSNIITVNAYFSLPQDNFKLKVNNVSCKGSNNGSLTIISSAQNNFYVNFYNSTSSKIQNFTSTTSYNNLAPGKYTACIYIYNKQNYSQCYDIVIGEPKDLSVYSIIDPEKKLLNLELSGAENQYKIEFNSQTFFTSNRNISLPLKDGNNTLKISTELQCQGVFEKTFSINKDVQVFPNPFKDDLHISLPKQLISKNIMIEVLSYNGAILNQQKRFINSTDMNLKLPDLSSGSYILKIKSEDFEQVIKIVKQ
jgi:hypothetical protein